jgi:transposase-like protein
VVVVTGSERLEVVETGRRRRWSEARSSRSTVLESLQSPRQVAATARRHGISRSLLLRGRQLFRPEPNEVPNNRRPLYQRGWSRHRARRLAQSSRPVRLISV